jgi:hypothetical protein
MSSTLLATEDGDPKTDEISGKLTSSFKRQKFETKAFNSSKLLAAIKQ